MYVMTYTRNGVSQKMLASGWTLGETRAITADYESQGYTVTFDYEVWR